MLEFNKIDSNKVTEGLGKSALLPSREFAWILGVLASGGYSNPLLREVSVDSKDRAFLASFKWVGEKVFEVNGGYRYRRLSGGEKEPKGVRFFSSTAEMVGDMGARSWPQTLKERHGWILGNSEFTWGFLEGVYERSGFARKLPARGVTFSTVIIENANIIAELLTKVGVVNPRFAFNRGKRFYDGIDGIYIADVSDCKLIAENIHPKTSKKEDRLVPYRQLKVKTRIELPVSPPDNSLEKVILELEAIRQTQITEGMRHNVHVVKEQTDSGYTYIVQVDLVNLGE